MSSSWKLIPTVCLLTLAAGPVLPAAAQSSQQEKPAEDPGRVIRFDALTRTFVPEPRLKKTLKHGKKLTLRVINPNNFRESYSLRLGSVDNHTAKPLGALAGLISLTSPTVSAGESITATVNRIVASLPDPLRGPFREAFQGYHGFRVLITEGYPVLEYPNLGAEIAETIRIHPTNTAIRAAVVAKVKTYYDRVKIEHADWPSVPTGPDGPDGAPDYPRKEFTRLQNSVRLLPTKVDEAIADHGKNYTQLKGLHVTWQEAYAKWQITRLEGARELTAAKAREMLLTTSVQELRKQVEDKKATPVMLEAAINKLNQAKSEVARLEGLHGEGVVKAAEQADKTITDLMKIAEGLHTARSNDLTTVRTRTAHALGLAIAAVDWTAAPPYIDKPGSANKDIATLAVDVEVLPQLDLDKRLEGTEVKPPTTAGKDIVTREKAMNVFGRPVLDFGTGLAATALTQETFFVNKNTGKVRRGARDSFDLGPALMAHLYRTSSSQVAIGPTFGIVAADPIRYLLGASLIIGNENRFALSVGEAFGRVTRLNGDRLGKEPHGSAVSTANVMRSGLFVSGTFTFTF